MANYSIRDLEKITGIKAHTIRIWEQRYKILSPKRTETNIRYYDDQDLRFLLNISMLNFNGLKISKIAKMSEEEVQTKVRSLCETSTNFPDQVNELTISMMELDEVRFERVIARNILRFNFEKTMVEIIYPFFTKVGVLWQTGSISPAHEHFISNLLRQKIMVAIDGQGVTTQSNAKKYLLYLPEGEMHELGLLFAAYLLKTRDRRVIYLGQNLPYRDLEIIINQYDPDYIFSIFTVSPSQDDVQNYVNKMGESFPEKTIFLTGHSLTAPSLKVPKNVQVLEEIDGLLEFLASSPDS